MKRTIHYKALMMIGVLTLAIATLMPLGFNDKAIADGEGDMTVRVLLYSGRPDPTYVLKEKVMVEKIKAIVSEAPKAESFKGTTVIPAILGYKGILINNPAKQAGLPLRIAVYKGVMEVQDGAKMFLTDKGEALEKMLMDEAIKRGIIDEVILKRMEKEQ